MNRQLIMELYNYYGDELLMSIEQEFSANPEYYHDFKFKEEFCLFTLKFISHSFKKSGYREPLIVSSTLVNIIPHHTELKITEPECLFDMLGSIRPSVIHTYEREYDIVSNRLSPYSDYDVPISARIYSKWYSKREYASESHYEKVIKLIDEVRGMSRIESGNIRLSSELWDTINWKNKFVPLSDILNSTVKGVCS